MRLVVVRDGNKLADPDPEFLERLVGIVLKVFRLEQHPRTLLDRDDPRERDRFPFVLASHQSLDQFSEGDILDDAHGDVHGPADCTVRVRRIERRDVKHAFRVAQEPDRPSRVPRAAEDVERLVDERGGDDGVRGRDRGDDVAGILCGRASSKGNLASVPRILPGRKSSPRSARQKFHAQKNSPNAPLTWNLV